MAGKLICYTVRGWYSSNSWKLRRIANDAEMYVTNAVQWTELENKYEKD